MFTLKSDRNPMCRRKLCDVARSLLVLFPFILLLTDCSCFVLRHYSSCISITTSRNPLEASLKRVNQIRPSSTYSPSPWLNEKAPRTGLGVTSYSTKAAHLDPNKQSSRSSTPENLGTKVVNLYVGYCKKLWRETSPLARKNFRKKNTMAAIGRVQKLVKESCSEDAGQENNADQELLKAKEMMLTACESMIQAMEKQQAHQQHEQSNVHKISKDERLTDSDDEKQKTQDSKTINEPFSGAKDVPAISVSNLFQENILPKTKHVSLKQESQGTTTEEPYILSSIVIKRKKPRRSILFGAAMGGVVACWVFSGNFIFTALFTLMTVLGQLEFYRMAMNAGIYPARRISVCGACAMFITALFAPNLHQVCLPLFATYAMIWFLTMRRSASSLSEIASTFTGMFLYGYVPSFWVRIRLIGGHREPTRLAPLVTPLLSLLGKTASSLPAWIPKAIHLPITTGAVFIFWSWLSIAFSDVGAYFSGRYFGRTKLNAISPAAGATSPNKTVEGVIGGTVTSVLFALCGAWVQKWPYWWMTGVIHGMCLSFLGLIGDLTASMLKRDAGLKDFGDLIPEHGGILDRVDSFIFTAPYSWVFLSYIIPWLKAYSLR